MLQINSEWTNNGNFPVYLDPKELEISIYAIKADSEVGFISFDRPGPKVGSLYPRKTWGEYFFEPKTKSIIQSVAIVEKGRSYLIKVSFGLDEKRHGSLGDNLWTYERCMVVHIPAQ